MEKGTKFFRYGPKVYFVIQILLFVSLSKLSFSETFTIDALDNVSTGVIGATIVHNDSIFVGAENGLYKITGQYVEHIDIGSEVLSGGFISSLSYKNDKLWVTVNGKGIFYVDMNSTTVHQVSVEKSLDEYFWSTAVKDNVLASAFVSGIALYDINAESLIGIYPQDSEDSDKEEYKYTSISGEYVYSSTNKSLIRISIKTGKAKSYDIGNFFPKLSSIEYVEAQKTYILVGGREGVYILDAQTLKNLSFSEFTSPSEWPISAMFYDGSQLWVAAGSVYINTNSYLHKANFLQPYLSTSRIAEISSINQLSSGQMVITSSQQGLVVLPLTYEHVNYLHIQNTPFPNAVLSALSISPETAFVSSESGYFLLDLSTGSLKQIYHSEFFDSDLILKGGIVYDSANCIAIDNNYSVKKYSDGESCNNESLVFRSIELQGELKAGKKGKYIELFDTSGSFIERVKVPLSTSNFAIDNKGGLVALSQNNELFSRDEGVWYRLDLPISASSDIVCIDASSKHLFLCTSGNGLLKVHRFGNLETLHLTNDYGSRYIRDALNLNTSFWVTSNNGLSVQNNKTGVIYNTDSKSGIFDQDFSYDGIFQLNETTLLINGDDFAYLINADGFESDLTRAPSIPRTVKVVKTVIDDRVSINDLSELANTNIESDINNVQLFVALSSQLNSRHVEIEYRIDSSLWTRLENEHGTISLTGQSYGEHQVEIRAINKKARINYPISTFKFTFLPPVYLSDKAIAGYLILSVIIALFTYRKYKINQKKKSDFEHQKQLNTLAALKESNEIMESMQESKDVAMSRISHEIRTPLMLVTEPIKAIAESITDTAILNKIDGIQRNALRVSTLVEQLLEIERLSSIRNVPIHKYDIAKSCVYLVESLRPLVEQKNQTLKTNLQATGSIFLVQDTLQQIFYNLLSNASKYSPGNTEITVKTQCKDNHLIIDVCDNGVGLTESERTDIFNRFSRLNKSDNEQGIGLGLSLLKQLVRANQGFIKVASNKGSGSCFSVNLPLMQNTVDALQPEKENEPDFEPVETSEKTVISDENNKPIMLIADDSDELRAMLFDLFCDDFLCIAVKNGKEALKAVEAVNPSVLLADNAMPEMSGIELVESIRSNEAHSAMIIFMLSGLQSPETIKSAYNLQIDDYMTKPFDQDILRRKVLNRYSARQQQVNSANSSTSAEFLGRIPVFENEKDQQFYVNLRACLKTHFAQAEFSRKECAQALFVSERQLNRKLKTVLDLSFSETLKQYRVECAKDKLSAGHSITDTAYDCGFSTPSYFSTAFKAHTGLTPSEFNKQHDVDQA